MNVFLFSTGSDVGGQAFALREAMRRQRPSWRVNQMRRTPTWGYPSHLAWDKVLARRLWRCADVVHLTRDLRAIRYFGNDRPIVLHLHGSEYRDRREQLDAECATAGVLQVASTLDLTGTAEWLPCVADVVALSRMRQSNKGGLVRIVHAPTNRALKGTDQIIDAIAPLRRAELDLVEGVPWAASLARKATADIVIDQTELGYGLNAIEAWAMGLPVVSGARPDIAARMLEEFGSLPFASLSDLPRLVEDVQYRHEWAQRGVRHVRRYHSQREVVARLEGIYGRAIEARLAA